ncbi:hypothetical protein CASFOL_018825 [Castilleja foliolosa]|uniref:DUF4283 domain-containing protein n=1 Tax=Castilleja foliolosa TaxID=1961234 RepID=A0ABD3D4R0_9LAMI
MSGGQTESPEPDPAAQVITNNNSRSFVQIVGNGMVKANGGEEQQSSGAGKNRLGKWFRLQPVAPVVRTPTYIDNAQACIISAMEVDEAAKQFKHALILKFTAGRPSLHDIRNHIFSKWGLEVQPAVSIIEPRHILVITENGRDMLKVHSQDSKRIQSSLFRVFRWCPDYDFTRDSPKIPVWISLPHLPVVYMVPSV